MFDTGVNTVIHIDTHGGTIRFYAGNMNRRQLQLEIPYACRSFSEAFYQNLAQMLKSYQQKKRSMEATKAAIILPDHLFLMDTISVPNIGKKAMENAVEAGIGAIYKNKRELQYHFFPLTQTTQVGTFGIVGVRKEILEKLQDICNASQVSLQVVTFEAGAMACGAMALNAKLRSGTGLVLDVQEGACHFAFVNKGRVIGTYRLPFGSEMLSNTDLVAEESLFDHSSAELMVRTAHEHAKSKCFAALDSDMTAPDGEETLAGGKKAIKKSAKLHTREMPTEAKGFIYENFRIILKWTLNLLQSNPAILAQGAIDTVYMNIAPEYQFLFDMLAEEENGVSFVPVFTGNRQPGAEKDLRQLTLFGGLQLKQYGKYNNF